jgi:hypothetical protein
MFMLSVKIHLFPNAIAINSTQKEEEKREKEEKKEKENSETLVMRGGKKNTSSYFTLWRNRIRA